MIIDFHTHVFPDKIADRTVELLAKKGSIPAFSDGKVSGLLQKMKEAGVDVSVTLPVITRPDQFESVNRYAKALNAEFADAKRRLISFAGIHPECDDIEKKMKAIKNDGFLGVKIHPDYQGCFITAEGYVKILECAKEYDLTVVTHSGVDAAYPDETKCPPALIKELIRKVRHEKFVLAHYGANEMHDEVLSLLCGEDVYFDTAYVLRFISEEKFKEILERHGEDKILFATDSPWSDMRGDVNIIRSFGLDETVERKILSENARRLLNI